MSARPRLDIRIKAGDRVERFREACLRICYTIKYRAESADRMTEWDRGTAATAAEISRKIAELWRKSGGGETPGDAG